MGRNRGQDAPLHVQQEPNDLTLEEARSPRDKTEQEKSKRLDKSHG